MAFFDEFFGAFLLGRDGVPRPAHKQGGLFGDVFADHAAALRNAGPEHGFIVGLEVAGERDIVAVECTFRVGLGVGLGNDAGCGGFFPGRPLPASWLFFRYLSSSVNHSPGEKTFTLRRDVESARISTQDGEHFVRGEFAKGEAGGPEEPGKTFVT